LSEGPEVKIVADRISKALTVKIITDIIATKLDDNLKIR
jgi:hypothetical protein